MDLRFKERFCPEEGVLEVVEFSFLDLDGDLVEGEFDSVSIRFKTKRLEHYCLDPIVLLEISRECIEYSLDLQERLLKRKPSQGTINLAEAYRKMQQ